LVVPFVLAIREQIAQDGWRLLIMYPNRTGLLDLPAPWVLIRQLYESGALDNDVVVKMSFPLMLMVALIMTAFGMMHFLYIITARTTLEHSIMLSMVKVKMLRLAEKSDGKKLDELDERPLNPFNEGWKANIRRVIGQNLWYVFLPIRVQPPPPFLPKLKDKTN
jgi:hypothetical protein